MSYQLIIGFHVLLRDGYNVAKEISVYRFTDHLGK